MLLGLCTRWHGGEFDNFRRFRNHRNFMNTEPTGNNQTSSSDGTTQNATDRKQYLPLNDPNSPFKKVGHITPVFPTDIIPPDDSELAEIDARLQRSFYTAEETRLYQDYRKDMTFYGFGSFFLGSVAAFGGLKCAFMNPSLPFFTFSH